MGKMIPEKIPSKHSLSSGNNTPWEIKGFQTKCCRRDIGGEKKGAPVAGLEV
jgi:hypothetical protein